MEALSRHPPGEYPNRNHDRNTRRTTVTYDLALYPASGPGLGHLMRCMALAEWAVELKAKAIVALGGPSSLAWPCAVALPVVSIDARVHIQDGGTNRFGGRAVWRVVDAVPTDLTDPMLCDSAGIVYPHFGAVPVGGFPTFVGPQWMPLRPGLANGLPPKVRQATAIGSGWCRYRCEKPRGYVDLAAVPDDEWFLHYEGVVCPPSTIAYEAMTAGMKVAIHEEHEHKDIMLAMFKAGAAVSAEDESRHRAHTTDLIDGLGARRLLEALL